MNYRLLLISIMFTLSVASRGQAVQLISLDDLQKRIFNESDTVYVVNFWATWCVPCVQELPHFQKFRQRVLKEPAAVLLVSVDFKSAFNKQVKSFVKRRNIAGEVYLLNEDNQQVYIERIDKSWSGTIPATLFVHHGKRKFREQAFTFPELLAAYEDAKNGQ